MTDIESLVARLEAPCIGNGMILRNPDGPDAIAAIRTLQTEKVELRKALEKIETSARGSGPYARDRDAYTLRAIELHAGHVIREISA